jgi:phosphoglycolate phosphatase
MALLVFDLDGTVVDSRADLAASANDVLESYGATPLSESDVAMLVGEGARMLVARALKKAGALGPAGQVSLDEALARFLAAYDKRLVEKTRPYAQMAEALTDARASGHRLALLTNKPEAPSRRLLEHFDLAGYFSWVIGGDSAFGRKPDPTGLNWLMREAGARPAGTVMIGDSQIDADTARNAGARFCLARYGFGQAREATVLNAGEAGVNAPSEIAAALRALALDA